MKFIETTQYKRTKKFLLKKYSLSKSDIENSLVLFQNDPKHSSLHYKKITCKRDKNRYSMRIPNTQYRILMNVELQVIFLVCICDHDEYDRRNKGC